MIRSPKFFNTESYYAFLKTTSLGRPCICLDVTDSTIDVALKECPNTVVLARQQVKGRGQRNNVWQSPVGCLMASLRLYCDTTSQMGSRLSFLQHIMALSTVETLQSIDSKKLGMDHIKLKWPNDIIYDHAAKNLRMKIGGVLVHTNSTVEGYDITMSIGLNIFNQEPTTCVQGIVGFEKEISIEAILADLINRLEFYTYDLTETKFEDLKSEYTQRCLQMNQIVSDETNGQVKIMEVKDDGYLAGQRLSDQKWCTVTNIIDKNFY